MDRNIFAYLEWRGDLSMESVHLNEADAAVFARFSYLPLELYFTKENTKFVPMGEVCAALLRDETISSRVLNGEDEILLSAIGKSPRFANLPLGNYVNILDKEKQLQFSACVIRISRGKYVIAFRGTDNTIIGWKEDLNMGFICPVDSQRMALKYLEEFMSNHNGKYYIVGHSKGGNLAVYSSVFASPKNRDRIINVYNFDGPGFSDEVLNADGYRLICDRIHTYVPQNSIVGTILGHRERYEVVHGFRPNPIQQHEVYAWEIYRDAFIREEDLSQGSSLFRHTMKDWLGKMNIKQREDFVEALYNVIAEMNADTLDDIVAHPVQNSKAVLGALHNMSDESKDVIFEGMRLFAKCMLANKKTNVRISEKVLDFFSP